MKSKPRFVDPLVRKSWGRLEPTTISASSNELGTTVPVIKHRRQMAEDGQFPDPIPVLGFYNSTSSLHDFRMLQLWIRGNFDLRRADEEKVNRRMGLIHNVAADVKPATLMGIAEVLAIPVLHLEGRQATKATKAIGIYREAWGDGRKPEVPDALASTLRRLRNWRETAGHSEFPKPLPVKATGRRSNEMFYSLVEVGDWLACRNETRNTEI